MQRSMAVEAEAIRDAKAKVTITNSHSLLLITI